MFMQSLVFWVVFIFSVFFWPLHCMSFFDFRLLITPLVSLDISYRTLTINPSNTMGATLELLTILEHLSSSRFLIGSVLFLFIYCVCPRWLLFCFWPRVCFPLLMTDSFYHVLVSYFFPVNENILLYSRHVRSIYNDKDHNGKYIISVLIQGSDEGLKWKFNKICDKS